MDDRGAKGSNHVIVKNTFLGVESDHGDENGKLLRSSSWSASSGSLSSSDSAFRKGLVPGFSSKSSRRPPRQFVLKGAEDSSSSSSEVPFNDLKANAVTVSGERSDVKESSKNGAHGTHGGDEVGSKTFSLQDLEIDDIDRNIEYGWSVGSEEHGSGQCSPCLYLLVKNGCRHGTNCKFCHMEHDEDRRKSRHRPCKAVRKQCRKLLSRVDGGCQDPVQVQEAYEKLKGNKNHPYMRNLIQGALEKSSMDTATSAASSSAGYAGTVATKPNANDEPRPLLPGLQPPGSEVPNQSRKGKDDFKLSL
eukprot:TRINITY_DN42704_c0_g1_i1.p1 TRINITY_DN42704_c0_g1~~TRINITY_DN42704_c0_g1_i1.p1  ORF type:complete len:305 (+),score=51.83 TRINITY_DN42704_c0_g1_i1:37-951(+)